MAVLLVKHSRLNTNAVRRFYFSPGIGRMTGVIPLYCNLRWIANAVSL
ncbi:MAG: hypothetical protein NTV10_06180 [Methanoregula sp.]|nr:hypothetical protein [Methanoregula sp.]